MSDRQPPSDRIVLAGMAFQGRHGVNDWEKTQAQRFEVDVELELDLSPAGSTDDLARTIDYRETFELVRRTVEFTTFNLIEALADAIARELLAASPPARAVTVRVRKPEVRLGGELDYAGVEIVRARDR
ncbi:MAG: dihydroneopterin aldolase [Chloroflexi bacterium]|nr:dihydroneopterin aldolase [Chloroflexota bacterium]